MVVDIGTALPSLEWDNTLNEIDPDTADGCVSSLKCVQGFSLRAHHTAAGAACDSAVCRKLELPQPIPALHTAATL